MSGAEPPLVDPAPRDETHLPASPLAFDPLTPGLLPLPRWFGVLVGVCAVGLIPWIVILAVKLPGERRSAHYDVAWVGFDIAMCLALAGLAVAARRHSTWTEPLAVCSATLLVVDAWFDIVTADGPMRRMEAVVAAVAIELPLALLCAWIAHNTERLRRRAYRTLWGRLPSADDGRTDEPPAPPRA